MTKIEWTDETWNPIVGCSKVSEGCQNCYAERMARRLKGMGLPQYQDIVDEHRWTGKIGYASESVWEKPLRWRKPRRVFVCSMGDLFHPAVDDNSIMLVFNRIARSPQHIYQILTKRPQEMNAWIRNVEDPHSPPFEQSFRNVWLGVTVERHDYSYRTTILADTPAIIRFVSFEPLLGPMDDYPGVLDNMDWAIIGCESGPGRRPMKLEWAIGLVDQCQAADVPVFVKQIEVNGRVSHDPAEWPPELRVREYPHV